MARYRWNADRGEEVKETDDEVAQRVAIELQKQRDEDWRKEQAERERKRMNPGGYL